MLAIEALVPTDVVGLPSNESREYTLDADDNISMRRHVVPELWGV